MEGLGPSGSPEAVPLYPGSPRLHAVLCLDPWDPRGHTYFRHTGHKQHTETRSWARTTPGSWPLGPQRKPSDLPCHGA